MIILIGNKADLEAQRDVTYEEAKQFAEENGREHILRNRFEIHLYIFIGGPLIWQNAHNIPLFEQACCSWRQVPKRKFILQIFTQTDTHYRRKSIDCLLLTDISISHYEINRQGRLVTSFLPAVLLGTYFIDPSREIISNIKYVLYL